MHFSSVPFEPCNGDADKEKDGMSLLTSMHGLVQPYQEIKGVISLSIHNTRSIFHCFSYPEIVPFVSKIGVCSDLDGFMTSDYIPFFMDLKSDLFDKTVQSITPPQFRVLQMYHKDHAETYHEQVIHQLKQQNITARLSTLQRVIVEEGFTTECSETL